jgi:hypothetical protein
LKEEDKNNKELSIHFMNSYMYGDLDRKSNSWKEAVKFLWGGSTNWEKRFYVLTNVGLLVY